MHEKNILGTTEHINPLPYPAVPTDFTTKQYVDARVDGVTADDVMSSGSLAWLDLEFTEDEIAIDGYDEIQQIYITHSIELDGEIPANADLLRIRGNVTFDGPTLFPNNYYQQLYIATSIEGENGREIANAGSFGPGTFTNEFDYTFEGFDNLKGKTLYLIHGPFGNTFAITLNELHISYRIPNPDDRLSTQANLNELKAETSLLETRFGEYTNTPDLNSLLLGKADKYSFPIRQLAPGGSMLNVVIDTQMIIDGPHETWHVYSNPNGPDPDGYSIDVVWVLGTAAIFYQPPEPRDLIIIANYGWAQRPNYMIPDDWTFGSSSGNVPEGVFKVLYGPLEIIQLLGRWDDLDLEAVTLIDAINQKANKAPTEAELALKSNISDIVNDLVTGGTAKPLSAEQGKVLDGKITLFAQQGQDRGTVRNALDSQGNTYSVSTIEITSGGADYEVGDTLLVPADDNEINAIIRVDQVNGDESLVGPVTQVSVVRSGDYLEGDTQTDIPLLGGSGTGAQFTVNYTLSPASTLASITDPQLNDKALVINDETHSGNGWYWLMADYDGDHVYHWIPLAPNNITARSFFINPLLSSEMATNAVTTEKITAGNVTRSKLSENVLTSLGKADTALQSFAELDPTVPAWAKQATIGANTFIGNNSASDVAPTNVPFSTFMKSPASQTASTKLLVAPSTQGAAPDLKDITDFVKIVDTQTITGVKAFQPVVGELTTIKTQGITPIRSSTTLQGFLTRSSDNNVGELLMETNGASARRLIWRTSLDNGNNWTNTSYLTTSMPTLTVFNYATLKSFATDAGCALVFRYDGSFADLSGAFIGYCFNVNGTYFQGTVTHYATGETITYQINSTSTTINRYNKVRTTSVTANGLLFSYTRSGNTVRCQCSGNDTTAAIAAWDAFAIIPDGYNPKVGDGQDSVWIFSKLGSAFQDFQIINKNIRAPVIIPSGTFVRFSGTWVTDEAFPN